MRRCLIALAMLVAAENPAGAPAFAQAAATPVFVSPMGEPFRGPAEGMVPPARWFKAADADGNGRLTLAEMRKDAARFFATLDRNHDGEIDPDELSTYETEVAPEIATLLSMSGARQTAEDADVDVSAKDSDGYPVLAKSGQGTRRKRRHRDEGLPLVYLDLTEPVSSADRNLNRGVSLAEFDAAAQQRFHLLDTANQGYLTPEGLRPLLH